MKKVLVISCMLLLSLTACMQNDNSQNNVLPTEPQTPDGTKKESEAEYFSASFIEHDGEMIPVYLGTFPKLEEEIYLDEMGRSPLGEECAAIYPSNIMFVYKDMIKVNDEGENTFETKNAYAFTHIERLDEVTTKYTTDVYDYSTGTRYETVEMVVGKSEDEKIIKTWYSFSEMNYISVNYIYNNWSSGSMVNEYFDETYEFDGKTNAFVEKYITRDASRKYDSENDFGDIKKYELSTLSRQEIKEKSDGYIQLENSDPTTFEYYALAPSKQDGTVTMYVPETVNSIKDYQYCAIAEEKENLTIYKKALLETLYIDESGKVAKYQKESVIYEYEYQEKTLRIEKYDTLENKKTVYIYDIETGTIDFE